MKPVIKTIDIETAPKLAYVWKFWRENISPKQLVKHSYVMSFASRVLGEELLTYKETRTEDDREVIQALVDELDMCDIVVGHNIKGFDLPTIRARAIAHGIKPWSPVKVIDTYQVAKRVFRFERNSLAEVARALGVAPKDEHKDFPGFDLWAECLAGNKKAWKEMRKYNIQDVVTNEEVYKAMIPWIPNHPNIANYMEEDVPVCPKCGHKHVHFRGYYYTQVGKYHRFQCQSCGGWGRTRYTVKEKEQAKALGTNAL